MEGTIKELKRCPFCGYSAVIVKEPLFYGNNRGYPGRYMVQVKCMNPLCDAGLPHARYDTVYNSMGEAEDKAIQAWNKRENE